MKTNQEPTWTSLLDMNRELDSCTICPRLTEFRKTTLLDQERKGLVKYWRKPVPGFGDENGRLLVVGLAPAARGGNRTGRVFTGDKSSDFLVSCLHEVELSNQPSSVDRSDGLSYRDMYLTAAVRCVPPENKPTPAEIYTCSRYLKFEVENMKKLKAVLCLGSIAFNSVLIALGYNGTKKEMKFVHGRYYDIGGRRVYCSYHPSPRNVNTGTLSRENFVKLLREVVNYLRD